MALGACSPDGSAIENTFDPCEPLALVTNAPTDFQQAGIEAGQALWRQHGLPAIGQPDGRSLEIRFDGTSPRVHGVYDDEAAVIHINTAINEQQVLAIVIAHELGHALGLQHVPKTERVSVMNPGNILSPPTAADQAAVEALWGACP